MKKNKLARESKTQARKAAQRNHALECAGDMLTGNYWIQVGLTNSQVRAITRLGKRWSIPNAPCATLARHLISLGLLNLEETQAKLVALTKYMKAEGFHSLGVYCDQVMRTRERLAKK